MKKVSMTLGIIHTDTHILLGKKKRGFGEGLWNGFGGKINPEGETPEQAMHRELQEEAGIIPNNLRYRGLLHFTFEDRPDTLAEVHVFEIPSFTGTIQESEEMLPQWFTLDTIPYRNMWSDAQHWLPDFLKGKHIKGKAHYQDKETRVMLSHSFENH